MSLGVWKPKGLNRIVKIRKITFQSAAVKLLGQLEPNNALDRTFKNNYLIAIDLKFNASSNNVIELDNTI